MGGSDSSFSCRRDGWRQGAVLSARGRSPCLAVPDSAAAHPTATPPPATPTHPPHTTCSYKQAWDSFVDAWLVVRVAQPDYAYRWRLQARRCCRAVRTHPSRHPSPCHCSQVALSHVSISLDLLSARLPLACRRSRRCGHPASPQ